VAAVLLCKRFCRPGPRGATGVGRRDGFALQKAWSRSRSFRRFNYGARGGATRQQHIEQGSCW